MNATKSTWFMTPALLLAASLSGQTFTVEGAGAGPVDLPEPLTAGAWAAELERFSESRDDHGTVCWPSSAPAFAIESKDYRITQRLRRVDEPAGGGFRVGVRGFPAGAAQVQISGSLTDAPDPYADPDWRWTLRFTKDGTPKPMTNRGDSFVVYGRGSPLEVPLPVPLTHGMWRVDLQTYKEGKPFGVYVSGGDFYLTSDFKRHCTLVSGHRNRSRVNVGVDVAAGVARLMPRQVQPSVLWSVRFTKDGAPLLPDPPAPPDDCPRDSVCPAPDAPPPLDTANPYGCPQGGVCLGDRRRFEAVAAYMTEDAFRDAAPTGADLGVYAKLFWFYDPTNPELLLKVLDGCKINGHHWVYVAAATETRYRVTIVDHAQDGTKSWEPVELGRAVADIAAFRCSAGD